MNTPDIEAWVCKECEQYGEIRQGSVHNIKAMNCRVKPSDPVFFDTNTPDTEWKRQLRIDFEVAYGSMPKNFEHVPSVHISDWWLEKLSSRDTYWKERVRKEINEISRHWIEEATRNPDNFEVRIKLDALDTLLDNLK